MAAKPRSTSARKAPRRTREQLEEYRRKRDFRKTAEPSGDVDPALHSGLQFVIQKHDASHLHYDLRLELDSVMRSWAVPKGPSLDPAVKRLAMQVEDHPMSYNAFEGTIPQGEYGGGTVMLWDRGTYSPDEAAAGERAEDAVRRGLKSGKLSFTLHGERLQGSFALVRTDRGPKPKWLLIKHRDETARSGSDITEEVLTSVESGRTMAEIGGEGDRVWRSNRGGRKGGEEEGVSSEADGATIAPMKPTPVRSVPDDDVAWEYEAWRGGVRVLAYVTADAARLFDEHARDVTRAHRTIADALRALARRTERAFVLDGELADGTFYVSDLLLDRDAVLVDQPWQQRRSALASLFARRRVPGVKVEQTTTDIDRLLRSAQREGWPGVIARAPDSVYEPGRRATGMLRIAKH